MAGEVEEGSVDGKVSEEVLLAVPHFHIGDLNAELSKFGIMHFGFFSSAPEPPTPFLHEIDSLAAGRWLTGLRTAKRQTPGSSGVGRPTN